MLMAFSENARGILKESPDPCERMLSAFSENALGILKESPDPCERMLAAFLKNLPEILEEPQTGLSDRRSASCVCPLMTV
jgi:hypothetical protein